MASLNAFLVAVEMAERQRDAARQALQDLQRARIASEAQLQQLQGYAHETEGRWGMRADATVKPEVMYHHYQFMDRLGHAMGVQSSVIGEQEGRVRAASQALLQAELRVAALRKVVERRRHDIAQAEARRDQKQTDERAALRFGKAPGAGQGPGGPEELTT
ncbi:flagellar export protein FliJ [Acidovorax sacchari]|uniref:flagellar export protein FliJ n=1 Tax=Acidovorax sacchari TaxID=3230736 RepID=UPI0039E6F88A